MHLVIPFAAPLSDAGRHALHELALPTLGALLARLAAGERDEGDEYRLSPPHERVVARAIGLGGDDGALPFAARAAAADGIDTTHGAWGLLSPVHWHVGAEHLTMGDPETLDLSADDSRAFLDAVRSLFETEGWRVAWGAPTRWYVSHASLDGLPTASLDRVIGRNPDLWMPAHPISRLVKRLQSEVQMLLYTHPLNEAREAADREPLNTVWLSGCGVRQAVRESASVNVDERLRAPALRADWAAWSQAWRSLDQGPLRTLLTQAERGEPVQLTLCGERHAQTFEAGPRGLMATLRSRFRPTPIEPVLQAL